MVPKYVVSLSHLISDLRTSVHHWKFQGELRKSQNTEYSVFKKNSFQKLIDLMLLQYSNLD